VKYFDWDDAKNAKLRTERGIGFEEIVFHIERGDLLDILEHPKPERNGGQRIFVVRREDYVYLVPFVEDEHTVFLKTIIPRRKATKEYSMRSPTMKIDADEKELLESVERGEWKSAGGGKRERARFSRYAKATFKKDRRLNIRLSSKDLEAIQKRALAEGLPYQTLIASLLHKYAAGRLKEV
jgi:predicted DNA binding CopG/RHH family protein/mRNA-degrading endonuclease RelE of RelBE toxin-antitoxin system